MGRDNYFNDAGNFFFLLDLGEHAFELERVHLLVGLVLNLKPVRRLDQCLQLRFTLVDSRFLLFQLLDTPQLIFQTLYLLLVVLLLFLQRIRYLFFELGFTFNYSVADFIKYFAYFAPVFVGCVLHIDLVVFNSEDLVLELVLFVESRFQRHI